jgi:hypothetical protein
VISFRRLRRSSAALVALGTLAVGGAGCTTEGGGQTDDGAVDGGTLDGGALDGGTDAGLDDPATTE